MTTEAVLAGGLVTFAGIRSAIGASSDNKEFSDSELDSLNVVQELMADIDDWLPSSTSRDAILTAGLGAEDNTAEARRLFCLQAYSKYFCAWLLVPALSGAMLARISDGQNDARRISFDPDKIQTRLQKMMGKYRGTLLSLLGDTSYSAGVTLMGLSSPDYDPILGE